MSITRIMESAKGVQRRLEREREDAMVKILARRVRAERLLLDPREIGFRRATRAHDVLPGAVVHLVEGLADHDGDPVQYAHERTALIMRWIVEPLDGTERLHFVAKAPGMTHKLLAIAVMTDGSGVVRIPLFYGVAGAVWVRA